MVTREDQVEQSVQDFVKDKLFNVGGYSTDDVVILDAFPYNKFDGPLDRTYVAMGFNFDDGGHPAEMGSTLKRRQYTLTFWVFAHEPDWGKNIANVTKSAAESDMVIPLKDYGINEPPQVIDSLMVDSASTQRQFVREPQPWEENIWTTFVKVTDEYYSGEFG